MTRHRGGGRWRRTLAATALLALAGSGLSLSTADRAEAGVNLLVNPGFETLRPDGTPHCWDVYGWGDNDHAFRVTDDARSGDRAIELSVTRRVDGDHKAMMRETPSCAPNVAPGHQYDLSVWYKSTSPDIALTLFRRDARQGWTYWTDVATPPASAAYRRAEVRTRWSRRAPTRSPGASPSTAPAPSSPTTTRWRTRPSRGRRGVHGG